MAAGDTRCAWQREECPPWCVVAHADDDHPHDRKHVGRQRTTAVLALSDAERPGAPDVWRSDELAAFLHRRDGEFATAVYIGDGERQRVEVEAGALSAIIASLVGLAGEFLA